MRREIQPRRCYESDHREAQDEQDLIVLYVVLGVLIAMAAGAAGFILLAFFVVRCIKEMLT